MPERRLFEAEGDFQIGLGVADGLDEIGIHFQPGFVWVSAAAIGGFLREGFVDGVFGGEFFIHQGQGGGVGADAANGETLEGIRWRRVLKKFR